MKKNNKFEIQAPTLNDKFELPDESYSLSNVQYYFQHIIKKHENPQKMIYVNKTGNRIISKIKTGFYFALLMP